MTINPPSQNFPVSYLIFQKKFIAESLQQNILMDNNYFNGHDSGSDKYIHILVSLRNTSLKMMVARIPNPVARKKHDGMSA